LLVVLLIIHRHTEPQIESNCSCFFLPSRRLGTADALQSKFRIFLPVAVASFCENRRSVLILTAVNIPGFYESSAVLKIAGKIPLVLHLKDIEGEIQDEPTAHGPTAASRRSGS